MSTLLFLIILSLLILAIVYISRQKSKIRELNGKIMELNKLSVRDPLTGLFNRRGGSEMLEHHHALLVRHRNPLNNFAVLTLDLNRFKGINDKYGHEVGDKVLIFFSDMLTQELRGHEHDIVVRSGGDEFLVILPECTLEQAMTVKQKIKINLIQNEFEANNFKLHLSTSVGISMAMTDNGDILQLSEVLELSDSSMYADKKLDAKGDSLGPDRRANF